VILADGRWLKPLMNTPFYSSNFIFNLPTRFVFHHLKTPRSNLDVYHMRGCGFFIIKPTKAENYSLNKLRSDLASWTHAFHNFLKKKWLNTKRNGRTGRLRSPRDLAPRLEVARDSRAWSFCKARGLSPRA